LLAYPGELPDRGRIAAIQVLRSDPFNCPGQFSDSRDDQCTEFKYMRTGIELLGAFRTPSLRNLADTAPYMHKGQLKTLEEVLQHYNEAPNAMIGHNEAKPLKLSRKELNQLEAFLQTLMQPAPMEQQ
jgi:cytochrome c peroxidase